MKTTIDSHGEAIVDYCLVALLRLVGVLCIFSCQPHLALQINTRATFKSRFLKAGTPAIQPKPSHRAGVPPLGVPPSSLRRFRLRFTTTGLRPYPPSRRCVPHVRHVASAGGSQKMLRHTLHT